MEGTSMYDIGAPVTGILCIGSESHGLSERVRQQVTQYVSIPRVGEAESLNAAMATGILLSHLVRR
jgi:TrmH family RNA methyltransferase